VSDQPDVPEPAQPDGAEPESTEAEPESSQVESPGSSSGEQDPPPPIADVPPPPIVDAPHPAVSPFPGENQGNVGPGGNGGSGSGGFAPPRSTPGQRAARMPPHNLRAEEAVLGAMLLSREAIADVVEVLEVEHFYRPAHGHVFDAVMSLYGSGEPVDAITVGEELARANLLDAVGGPGVLIDLQAETPAIGNAAHYARIVEEHALLRRLISVSSEIAEMAYGVPEDVVKAVDDAEARMFDVAQRRVTNTTSEIKDLLSANLDRLELLYEQGDTITGTLTGYTDLDDLTSGLQPNAFYVVGARPAMGKTAFALGMASNAAMQSNRPVLVFSLEMSQLELSQRILSADARVDATRMKTGRLEESDWNRITHSVGRLAEAPIYIDDNPHTTVMEIRAKARRLKSRTGDLAMVVVDYIQLMTGRSNAESRQVEVAEISRNLKILARELECPVVALAQLNRGLEQRQDKRPMLSDLRESGALEQDADVVMFLYRDEIYHPESDAKGIAEVIVAKHRNGPTATVKLAFLGHFTRYENMSRRTPPPGGGAGEF
jgi:replicative DNA helicase